MRIAAVDMGDVWTGVALSDPSGLVVKPYATYESAHLLKELALLFEKERVTKVIIGYPQTMRGTESEQTKKIINTTETIKKEFPDITFIMLDERNTSKEAIKFGKKGIKTKTEKLREHAIAAALLLKSYLDYINFEKEEERL